MKEGYVEGQDTQSKTEAEVLAEVVDRNENAAKELTFAVNGTFHIDDEVDKGFAIASLVRDLTKALGPLGFEVRSVPKPKAPGTQTRRGRPAKA